MQQTIDGMPILRQQPNGCVLASFAMAMNRSDLLDLYMPETYPHVQDIIRSTWKLFSVVEFCPRTFFDEETEHIIDFNNYVKAHVLPGQRAVVVLYNPTNYAHAMAWSGKYLVNPADGLVTSELPLLECVWVVRPVGGEHVGH